MKEQVKEWIVDKNLTTDSFDSIMIGVIYNSGHSTLDDPDVRKWIETHPGEFREMLPPKLSDDQQAVLEWLKQYMLDDSDFKNAICELSKLYIAGIPYKKEEIAFKRLSDSELAQVLAAFAEWGMANA